MKNYSVFDILGPIMIGPSSSHTAGAARIGKIAKELTDTSFNKVTFNLHGSFAQTYKGHGTDKALVAGILGMTPSDERIRTSFDIAKKNNIEIDFIEKDLGYVHPNTVQIVFHYDDKDNFRVTGSSIGGGNVIITNINNNEVNFTGDYPTILVKYDDKKGIISKISSILANYDVNIATMNVTRANKIATLITELDSQIDKKLIETISTIDEIIYITAINPIKR